MDAVEFPEVVELNVGGKLVTTLLSTLQKDPDSMLAAMFSGRHVISKAKDGRFFIDCNADVFENILNYLRFGSLPPKDTALQVYGLAKYFAIQPLTMALECYHPVHQRKRIEELQSSLDVQEYERVKQKALKELYTSSASCRHTIHLFICVKLACVYCLPPHHRYNYSPVSITDGLNILLETGLATSPDFLVCLAHDMCELGFGMHSKCYGPNNSICNMCRNANIYYQIVLTSYKIIQLTNGESVVQ